MRSAGAVVIADDFGARLDNAAGTERRIKGQFAAPADHNLSGGSDVQVCSNQSEILTSTEF